MGLPPGRPCPPCAPEGTQANIQLGPLQNGVLDLSWQGRQLFTFLAGFATNGALSRGRRFGAPVSEEWSARVGQVVPSS
jgi:hypothetical protein